MTWQCNGLRGRVSSFVARESLSRVRFSIREPFEHREGSAAGL
jgi:hypothetical protein